MRNEEVLHRVKEERNILHTVKRRNTNWISHFCVGLAFENTSLKERLVTGGRGRRLQHILDDLKDTRRYWKLKEDVADRTLSRTRSGGGYGPVVRQTTW
jgi:hypothetical protein